MRKLYCKLYLLMIPILSLIGCSSETGNLSSEQPSSTELDNIQQEYRVEFVGSSLNDKKVAENTLLYEPEAPTKEGFLFLGWYVDSNYENLVSFPLKVKENTKIYARYERYKDAFIIARDNTIGDSVNCFEYDYTINASATAFSQKFSGSTTGNTKINKTGEISFYDVHQNSGILFNDGKVYQVKHGNDVQIIEENENGIITNFKNEKHNGELLCDFNSFAKAIFTYEQEDIVDLTLTDTPNKYELTTKKGFSDFISLVGNNLNNPLIENLIIKLPETSVNTNMFVSFKSNKIYSYSYQMTINVSELEFKLTYDLFFNNVGVNKEIEVKSFDNIYFSNNDLLSKREEMYNYIESFLTKESSGYDFTVNTAVDYGFSSFEINSTFSGKAFRNCSNGNVYFYNDIEIDSDYKNKDLYGGNGLKDVHIKKTKLLSGEVYVIEKKLLTDGVYLQEGYTQTLSDERYLLNSYLLPEKISFVQVDKKNDETVYSVGISDNEIAQLLKWLNTELNLDPLNRTTERISVFGNFVDESIVVEDMEYYLHIQNGEFKLIEINCVGQYETSFVGSRDFGNTNSASFKVEIKIQLNKNGYTFVPFEQVKDAQ